MKYAILFLIVIALSCKHQPESIITYELNSDWQFCQEDDSSWYPAKVPGVVHLDLLQNHLIDDPFYANNELKQRWIEGKNWLYRTKFSVSKELLGYNHICLNFTGLDTYAEIWLNGHKILECDNMFRNWEVDVKPWLKAEENILELKFTSPINKNKEKVRSYFVQLPSGNEPEDIPVKVYSFTRKAAYQFGWDWAPRFVTCGIWRPVFIKAWQSSKINNVYTQTLSLDSNKAFMHTQIDLQIEEEGDYTIICDSVVLKKHLKVGTQYLNYTFEVVKPELWWCNGMGKAHLYHQKIILYKNKQFIDSASIKYGIRTIELINEADSMGTSFYFKLNGKAIFVKGANYVPQDVFLPRVSENQYKYLIQAVKDAHMNMLRVWGGGIYENDLFYDLCDKNGILVWQDFMFSGSLYPVDSSFIATIEKEIRDNVIRLRNHPCLALWCGNNEIEVAWRNWGWQKKYGYHEDDSALLWNNYQYVFQKKIPAILKRFEKNVPYVSTTPQSNWGNPENFKHGSMHYWGVWHGKEPFENFEKNVGRFMVEYGFQSFPELSTLKKVIPKSAMNLASPEMQNRQKSYIGNGLILKHIEQYYKKPNSFENFITLSQKTQAKALEMAIGSHIKAKPFCMGSMFWQLNDCWPGPGWSVIDYYGKKKSAYYSVQKLFGEEK